MGVTGGAGAGVGAGCSQLHERSWDRGNPRRVPDVLEKGGEDRVNWDGCNDRGHGWSVCEGNRLGSRQIYTNGCRGRACVGSLTMGSEVFYREIRDGGKGPPCAVTDEGVVERVFPVVKRVEVGTRLLIAGEEEVFGFPPSEIRWIV